MRISDGSSDVCSSDLIAERHPPLAVESRIGADIVEARGGFGSEENLADDTGRANFTAFITDAQQPGWRLPHRSRLAQPILAGDQHRRAFGAGIDFEDTVDRKSPRLNSCQYSASRNHAHA